jgi:hypothetical protein
VDRALVQGLSTLQKIKAQQARAGAVNATTPKGGDRLADPLALFLNDPNVREIQKFRAAMRSAGIIDKVHPHNHNHRHHAQLLCHAIP